MIQLDPRPVAPEIMNSEAMRNARDECIAQSRRGEKFDFTNRGHWTKAKKDLWEYQNGKCCFCERKRDVSPEADVEHFRPKAAVTEEPTHGGYQWLAYEWEHLFYSCKKCNMRPNKGNQFPISGTRAFTIDDDLQAERPLFIRPDLENPEDYITYEWVRYGDKLAKPKGCDAEKRGETTIKALGLDSNALAAERAQLLTDLKIYTESLIHFERSEAPKAAELLEETIGNIREKISKISPHAGFARYFVKAKLGSPRYERLFGNA